MEIWHRVSFNASVEPHFLEAIKDFGIISKTLELPGKGGMMVFVDINEANPHWQIVSELISTYDAVNMMETFFTREEVQNASWLRLISTFEQGYPQPKSEWPLKQMSYEIICPKCALYTQTRPMRLAKEPFLGKKSFMSLIWTNEILCRPEVIHGLQAIHAKGFEDWPALIHKTGLTSEMVHQLYIPGLSISGIIENEDLDWKTCPVCGTIKYRPHVRGLLYLKKEALKSDVDFLLTNEWFGHGGLAWREILVSNRVANYILDKGWSGVRFKVVEVV